MQTSPSPPLNQATLLNLLKELEPFLVGRERIIDAVQPVIDRRGLQQARQRRQRKHAARRDPDVAMPHFSQSSLLAPPLRNRHHPIELERKHLSHMSDHDLQFREAVEESAGE